MSNDIDIIIPWVDGNDPSHRRRRLAAMNGDAELSMPDVGGDTRYASLGELRWALASVNRFAPWVRKIWIVTDNQQPRADMEWARTNSRWTVPVEIVDHRVIFRGYEDLLPVFNCNSIEAMMWRIPGLADKFLYFNDDTMIISPSTPSDWFDGDKIVCYGRRFSLRVAKLLQWLRPRRHGHKPQGYKTPMIAAAEACGADHFIYPHHSPLSQLRPLLEEFFSANPDILRATASYKFRNQAQLSPQALCNLLAERRGLLDLRHENRNLFLKPTAKHPDYLTKRLERADKNPRLLTCCINSLDQTTDEERNRFARWIEDRLATNHAD